MRTKAGVFDVSHMGELRIAGDGAREYLQARLSNDLDRADDGQAQYTLLTNERGGIVDDLIAYRRGADDYLLVVNASNVEPDHAALAETDDVSGEWAIPRRAGARGARAPGSRDRAVHVPRRNGRPGCAVPGGGHRVYGRARLRAGCATDDAVALWDAILERGIQPCGLGARDTLRLEVCYPLHGNDISPERTPIEAGLGWACALDKDFTGVDVLRRQKAEGPREKLVAFVMDDAGIPRSGMAVAEGGEVTSGTLSPMLDVGIGLAYVPAGLAEPGTEITIDLRGRPRRAHIVRKPFYKREEP